MAMDLFEAISGRRSVRDYTTRRPDDAVISRLLTAAVSAPSARDGQPWRFTVVRDRELIDRLSAEAKAYQLVTLPAGKENDARRARMADPGNHLLHHAPALILISAVERSTWAVEDCALASQNLMLVAWSLGLGSCWIGNVQSYLNTPDGKRLLSLPEGCVPVAPIVVGYPASEAAPVSRNEPVVSWIG
jgi:nitroreductase